LKLKSGHNIRKNPYGVRISQVNQHLSWNISIVHKNFCVCVGLILLQTKGQAVKPGFQIFDQMDITVDVQFGGYIIYFHRIVFKEIVAYNSINRNTKMCGEIEFFLTCPPKNNINYKVVEIRFLIFKKSYFADLIGQNVQNSTN
jgi:hypothetical protein